MPVVACSLSPLVETVQAVVDLSVTSSVDLTVTMFLGDL